MTTTQTASTIIDRIVADNDPRNGSVGQRLVRMIEDRDDTRKPTANGLYPDRIGVAATTTVYGIGGRAEKVTGQVVEHRRHAVVLETESHGRIVVPLDKLEGSESGV